jgi:hypothetical protein
MAKILGYPVINSVVIPILLVIVLNGAKLLARPGGPAPEDRMYGLDLVIVALAYEFTGLGLYYAGERTHPDLDYSFVVNTSWIVIGLLSVVVMFGLLVLLRAIGYPEVRKGEWVLRADIRRWVNRIGLYALIGTFTVDTNIDKLYQAWTGRLQEFFG